MKTLTELHTRLIAPLGLAGLFALAGATGLPGHALAQEAQADGDQALFYPSLPSEPRLQYLTKLSKTSDVSDGQEGGLQGFLFGDQADEFVVSKPFGLAVFEGMVLVTDMRANGYGVFDMAAGKTRFVQPGGAGAMKKPINITVDSDGTRYITDTARNQVLVFDKQDRFLRAFGEADQFRPVDVVVSGERLYVSDVINMQIHVLDKRTGELLSSFGEPGAGPGQLLHPTSLAQGLDGTIWVTDTNNYRVQQFSAEGEWLSMVGGIGTSPGKFARPKGIAVDRDGVMYISDASFQNVQILDADGTPLLFFGGGQLSLPSAVKIDYDNVKYFEKYADPDFEIEYLVFVVSQFGGNKVLVYGYGSLDR